MAAPKLVPCLVSLRGEFNELAPDRDHESDGWIADAAHYAEGDSDHIPDEESAALRNKDRDSENEVHAIDVDRDLNKQGWSMERAVGIIVARHRSGKDNRLSYVIFNRKICGAYNGWQWEPYFGANPHDKHAHFSSLYDTAAERNTEPWGLLAADREDDDVTDEDVQKIASKLGKDMDTNDSGIAKSLRRQVDAAVADNFKALNDRLDRLESAIAAIGNR